MATVFLEYRVNLWAIGAIPLGLALESIGGGSRRKPDASVPINWLIERSERAVRLALVGRGGSARVESLAGLLVWTLIVGLLVALSGLLVEALGWLGGPATLFGRAILIAWCLSFRGRADEIVRAPEAPDLATARRASARFADRGTGGFDRPAIDRARVRALGEWANQRVVTPLFWLALAGIPGLWASRAARDLGTNVGNGPRASTFGFASARLNDLASFVPSRLSWLLISLSATLVGEDGPAAFRAGRIDAGRSSERRADRSGMSLIAALGTPEEGSSPMATFDGRMVRRAWRIVQIAGFHAAFLAIAYRVVLWGD